MNIIRNFVTVICCVLSANAIAEVTGYSDEPLQKPVFESARVLVESVSINNWLNENYKNLSPQQTQGVREHLHALIDSQVKAIYARDKTILPKKPDPVLATLFSWAGRVGVYGADETYRAVRGTVPLEPPPGPRPPDGLAVSLQGDLLKVTSAAGGWEASVPYHFFIFNLSNAVGSDGNRLEAAIVSTGSAPDSARPGYSQATLAIFFAPGVKLGSFTKTWLERLNISANVPARKIASTSFESRTSYDASTRLHNEAVFLSSSKGSFLVLYSGLDGTYQWNHPHFINFLASLRLEPRMAHPMSAHERVLTLRSSGATLIKPRAVP